jgi:hypothetical protein
VRIFRIEDGRQTLLTTAVEGIDRRLLAEPFLGLAISGATLLAVDHAFASDRGGVNRFDPPTGAFPDVTAESALVAPSGLAVVDAVVDVVPGAGRTGNGTQPEWIGGALLVVAGAALALWRLRRHRPNPPRDAAARAAPDGPSG